MMPVSLASCRRTCPTIAALALLLVATNSSADDWPQFRGPNCTGISASTRPLPLKFSPTEGLRWSADVGDGIGGAVIVAGRLFVSGMTGDETVSLFGFDVTTGKQLWRRDWKTGMLAEVHRTNSQASSTPA